MERAKRIKAAITPAYLTGPIPVGATAFALAAIPFDNAEKLCAEVRDDFYKPRARVTVNFEGFERGRFEQLRNEIGNDGACEVRRGRIAVGVPFEQSAFRAILSDVELVRQRPRLFFGFGNHLARS